MVEHIRSLRSNYNLKGLNQNGRIMVEYIWIGARGPADMRSKVMTVDASSFPSTGPTIEMLRTWNFDGSSTNQAPGHNSEVLLVPRKIYRDPFRRGDNLMVLCDTQDSTSTPLESNYRDAAKEVLMSHTEERVKLAFTQSYVLTNPNSHPKRPLNWPNRGFPAPEGDYSCGVGASQTCNRKIMEDHYKICLYTNINIDNYNAGAMLGQWSYEIGATEALEAGDDLWMSRWLLMRLAESFNCNASFNYRLVTGNWSPSTASVSFSNVAMRGRSGIRAVEKAMEGLKDRHDVLLQTYGTGRTNADECSRSSVVIPTETKRTGKGYLKDARLTADFDPYIVSAVVIDTVCNEGQRLDDLSKRVQQVVNTYPDVY